MEKIFNADISTSIYLEAVLNITECDFTTVDNTWGGFSNLFPYYRIYLVTDGEGKLIMKDRTIALKKGYLYFIPAFSLSSATCTDYLSHYWMHFNIGNSLSNYLTIYKPYIEVKADELDYQIFKLIKEKFDKKIKDSEDDSSSLACESLSKYLFSKFITKEKIDKNAVKFVTVLKYIDTHINEKISNEALAKIMNYNTTYFCNAFTKVFDIPPNKYILGRKMNLACKMLIEDKITIKEISFKLGFDNEMYFSRLFNKYLLMSPGKYRSLFK